MVSDTLPPLSADNKSPIPQSQTLLIFQDHSLFLLPVYCCTYINYDDLIYKILPNFTIQTTMYIKLC